MTLGWIAAAALVAGLLLWGVDRLALALIRPPHKPVDVSPAGCGLEYREVEFASHGVTLRGWLLLPPHGTSPLPPVVLTHGWTGTSGLLLPLGIRLARQGAPALVFDVRGHGRSGTAGYVTARHFRDDVMAAAEWLAAVCGADAVVLAGHSMGGAASILAAAEGTPVRGLILLAAPGDLMQVTARYLSDKRLPGDLLVRVSTPSWRLRAGEPFAGLSPIDRLSELDVPVFIAHGSADVRVPLEEGERLAGISGGTLLVVEGAAHTDLLGRPELDGFMRGALIAMK